MNSKEALEKICLHCEYYHQDMCFRAIAGCKEWHKLEKDLEILEILKKEFHITLYSAKEHYDKMNIITIQAYGDYEHGCFDTTARTSITKEQYNKLKEWLDNEI